MSSYVQAQLHVDISDLVDLPNQPSKNRACFPRHDDITQKRNVTQCEKGEISLRAEGDAVSVRRRGEHWHINGTRAQTQRRHAHTPRTHAAYVRTYVMRVCIRNACACASLRAPGRSSRGRSPSWDQPRSSPWLKQPAPWLKQPEAEAAPWLKRPEAEERKTPGKMRVTGVVMQDCSKPDQSVTGTVARSGGQQAFGSARMANFDGRCRIS